MSKVVILNGGNSRNSRLTALHEKVEKYFYEVGYEYKSVYIHELPAEDLLSANFKSKAIVEVNRFIEAAQIIVILTPIYKASFTGILKTYLDLLPQKALVGKTIIPIAIGGSLAHLLSLEYALKPVLAVLGATSILPSSYVVDTQVERLQDGSYFVEDVALERLITVLQDSDERHKSLD